MGVVTVDPGQSGAAGPGIVLLAADAWGRGWSPTRWATIRSAARRHCSAGREVAAAARRWMFGIPILALACLTIAVLLVFYPIHTIERRLIVSKFNKFARRNAREIISVLRLQRPCIKEE